jgi:hypothetical protein
MNNYDVVSKLADPQQPQLADQTFNTLQQAIEDFGRVSTIEIAHPSKVGDQYSGFSTWKFPKQEKCYITRLAQNGTAWTVVSWNEAPCSQ